MSDESQNDGKHKHGKDKPHHVNSHHHDDHTHEHGSEPHDHSHGDHHSHDESLPHVHFNFIEGEDREQTLKRIRGAFFLNFAFALIELAGGFYTNSVSIMSNAVHDFGDSFTLATAYVLEKLSYKKSNSVFSYGYRRLSSVAAVATGLVLIIGSFLILGESIPRILNPQVPDTKGMFILALLGVTVNGFAAFRMSKGASNHERMLVLHLLEDVLGWVVILIGSIIMMFFPWYFLDPLMAALVSIWILKNVYVQLKNLLRIILQGAPLGIEVPKILSELKTVAGVQGVHHPHLWTIDGRTHIFTAHIVVAAEATIDSVEKIKGRVKHRLLDLGISEATLEMESSAINCESHDH